MGIFYEEVVNNKPQNNKSIIIPEFAELLEERNELLEQMIDMFLIELNESLLMEANYFDDLKIKKEDLADPNKVKVIVTRIERDNIAPNKKDTLLNFIYGILLFMVACVPGTVVVAIGCSVESGMVAGLGYLLSWVCGILAALSLDRYSNYRSKTERALKKVNRAISKETDPELLKIWKKQKEGLEKSLKILEDADFKDKKDKQNRTISVYTY